MGTPELPRRLAPGSPLTALAGIGPVRSAALAEAGFTTVEQLLWHLPARYEDRRRITRVQDVAEEGRYAVVGRVRGLETLRLRRRMTLVRGRLEQDGASLRVAWFNRPYLARQLTGDRDYLLFGAVRRRPAGLEMLNPTCEPAAAALEGGALVPVYAPLGGLGPAAVRRLARQLVERLELPAGLPDPLPEPLRRGHRLPELGAALTELHRPDDDADLERLNAGSSAAHRRLVYGELFRLQLALAVSRRLRERSPKHHRYRIDGELRARLAALPPFELTGAQRRSLDEILDDLARPAPMQRLLQGDVASGKTVVAALALAAAAESGLQGALMAPTELLAEQHFRSLSRLLGGRLRLVLVTRSAPDLPAGRRALADGSAQLAVGTHALIQESVEFWRLGLAVVDEQHRFGVAQRRRLESKGDSPDLLVMTATPIPRSLALTVYGDLSLSVLDEQPPGRTPVTTLLVESSRRRRVYRRLAERVRAGDQAYVVFPLIEESDRLAAASIERLGAQVRRWLDGLPCAVLHGRTPPEERELLMREFAAGRLRVLISTTVIEVGVDVAAAAVMVVESAERFGLAQLHQLRGRVGRGAAEPCCIAVHGELSELAGRRLDLFAATTDGFALADADLELRGPGELLGTRQAGYPSFRVADLARDRQWIEAARRDARRLTAERPRAAERLLAKLGGTAAVAD